MIRKIKVKVKAPIEDTPRKIMIYGETKQFYKQHDFFRNERLFVGVIEYKNRYYFLVEKNGEIISCVEM